MEPLAAAHGGLKAARSPSGGGHAVHVHAGVPAHQGGGDFGGRSHIASQFLELRRRVIDCAYTSHSLFSLPESA